MTSAMPLPEVYRCLVAEAYKRWNPEKLRDIDMLMSKFSGREADLFDQVITKYVFAARPLDESQLLVYELMARFDPGRLQEVPRLLSSWRGRESELYRRLCNAYLARWRLESPPLNFGKGECKVSRQLFYQLVKEAYTRWNPSKLGDIDMLMEKYAGREAELFEQVTQKYLFAPGHNSEEGRRFLAELVARLAPPELPHLDHLLRKYARRELEMFTKICAKYLHRCSTRASGKKGHEVLEVSFEAGPLGMGLRGAEVVKIAPGQQAAISGVELGYRLLSMGGEEVPLEKSEEELKEWVMHWIQEPRPLTARFSCSAADAAEKTFGEVAGSKGVRAKRNEEAGESATREEHVRARHFEVAREAEEKALREAEERAKREAEEKARKEAEELARKAEEEKLRKEAEEKARQEEEEHALQLELARKEAEEKARREEEEEKNRRETEERARKGTEEITLRKVEEEKVRKAEEKAKQEEEDHARQLELARKEAEDKAQREEEEEKAKREKEEKASKEAEEEQLRNEAEEKARKEAEETALQGKEESSKKKAEEKARNEAEQLARQEKEVEVEKEYAEEKKEEVKKDEEEEEEEEEAEEKARKEVEEAETANANPNALQQPQPDSQDEETEPG